MVPAAVHPAATLFEGVPQQLLAGAAHPLRVLPRDCHGNQGASGAVVRVEVAQQSPERGVSVSRACAVRASPFRMLAPF